jgi:hypothetical protein
MKRALLAVCLLAGALQACESGPELPGGSVGVQPGPVSGDIPLSPMEKFMVAQSDGKPLVDLLRALGTVSRGRTKEQLIRALDSSFEIRCHETCEVKGK